MRQGDIFSSACRWGSPAQHRHGSPTAACAAHHALGHLHVHSQALTGFNGMLPAHFLSLRHHLPGQLTPSQLHMASHHHCRGTQWGRGGPGQRSQCQQPTYTPLPLSPSLPKRPHPCNPSQRRCHAAPHGGFLPARSRQCQPDPGMHSGLEKKREKQFLPLTTEAFLGSNDSPRVLDA